MKVRYSRSESLASAEFQQAFAAALAKRRKPICKRGHNLADPNHVHVGDLMRTGRITCNTCWKSSAEKGQASKTLAQIAEEIFQEK